MLLAVAASSEATFEVGPVSLTLTGADGTAVGGAVNATVDGVISTRRGNAGAWIPILGRSPAGTWRLTLPDTEEKHSRFRLEQIEDLLLIVAYEGRTPAWPV